MRNRRRPSGDFIPGEKFAQWRGAIFAIGLTAAFLVIAGRPALADSRYRVLHAEGNTGVVLAGQGQPSTVRDGLPVEPGDRFLTGANGRIEIASPTGTVLALEKNGALKINKTEEGDASFFLKVGRLLARFSPVAAGQKGYRVRTPVAVAAVRGTELGLDVQENGATDAGVIEGKVDFGASDKPEETAVAPEAVQSSAAQPAAGQPEDSNESPMEEAASVPVSTGEGVSVQPNRPPERLQKIPPVLVASLDWFPRLREQLPTLRDRLKELDSPSRRHLRQEVSRERVHWNVPQNYLRELSRPGATLSRPNPKPEHPDITRPESVQPTVVQPTAVQPKAVQPEHQDPEQPKPPKQLGR